MSRHWQRGVSIVGVGYTPFGSVLESPELKGMTERELLSWAVLEAVQDTGITIKNVDSLIVSNYLNDTLKSKDIQAVANEWLGLQKKPSFKIEAACGAPISGIMLAGSLIASGIVDIVVVSAVNILTSMIDENVPKYRKQPAIRVPADPDLLSDRLAWGNDQAYVNPIAPDVAGAYAAIPALAYAQRYGLTLEQLDDALSAAVVSLRRNAVRHPRGVIKEEYKDLAKKAGFSDVMEYMRSTKYNPYVSWPIRTSHLWTTADGAAALVLCPTEDAHKYTNKPPVEVSGVAVAAGNPFTLHDLLDHYYDTYKQAYSMANLDPTEIDYFGCHDWSVHYHLLDSEAAGYIPKGQAWKYIIDGRTAFDGDKPINTHGGEIAFGNAFDPASIVDIAEPVQQMRGECGDRQIHPFPKCAVVRALGVGIPTGVVVLRKKEV